MKACCNNGTSLQVPHSTKMCNFCRSTCRNRNTLCMHNRDEVYLSWAHSAEAEVHMTWLRIA